MGRLLFGLKLWLLAVLAVSAGNATTTKGPRKKTLVNLTNQFRSLRACKSWILSMNVHIILNPHRQVSKVETQKYSDYQPHGLSNRAADGIRFPHHYQLPAIVPDAVLVSKTTALWNRISLAHFRTSELQGAYV